MESGRGPREEEERVVVGWLGEEGLQGKRRRMGITAIQLCILKTHVMYICKCMYYNHHNIHQHSRYKIDMYLYVCICMQHMYVHTMHNTYCKWHEDILRHIPDQILVTSTHIKACLRYYTVHYVILGRFSLLLLLKIYCTFID